MRKEACKELLREYPRREATFRTLVGFKSKKKKPLHSGELIFSNLLIKDSRVRITECYKALERIRGLDHKLDETITVIINKKLD